MNSKILISFVVLIVVAFMVNDVRCQALGPFRLRGPRLNMVGTLQRGLPRPVRPRGGRVSPDFQSGAADNTDNADGPASDNDNNAQNTNVRKKNPLSEKTVDYDLHLFAKRLADFDNYY